MFGGRSQFFDGPMFARSGSTWSVVEYSYEFGSFGRPGGHGGTHRGGYLSDPGVHLGGSLAIPDGFGGTHGGVCDKLFVFGVSASSLPGWFLSTIWAKPMSSFCSVGGLGD